MTQRKLKKEVDAFFAERDRSAREFAEAVANRRRLQEASERQDSDVQEQAQTSTDVHGATTEHTDNTGEGDNS